MFKFNKVQLSNYRVNHFSIILLSLTYIFSAPLRSLMLRRFETFFPLTFKMADPRLRQSENDVIVTLLSLDLFEFTDFCSYYSLPDFQCRSLNPVEATEGRGNHRPGLRGPKLPVMNEVKFCNVPTLESFGTLSMLIYSLILNDWLTEFESFFCNVFPIQPQNKWT